MTPRFVLSQILRASILVLAASSVAEAGTVFTNFDPALTYDINSGNPVGNAFDGNQYAEADSFIPTASSSLQSVRIALSCAVSCPDPIDVSLTTDVADQPGLVLESFVIAGDALGPLGTNNPPLLLLSVLHPALTMGTRYWLSVSAGLSDTVAWNLNTTGDVSDQAISTDNGATWFAPSGNTPGALEVDVVPEPGSSGLLICGALLLSLLLKRRERPLPADVVDRRNRL